MVKWASDDICHWFDEFDWNLIWASRYIIPNPIYLSSYFTWCNQPQLEAFLFRFRLLQIEEINTHTQAATLAKERRHDI